MCSEQQVQSSVEGVAGAWFGCQCKQCHPDKSNGVVGHNTSWKVSQGRRRFWKVWVPAMCYHPPPSFLLLGMLQIARILLSWVLCAEVRTHCVINYLHMEAKQDHRITELLRLEKTCEVIESKH